MNMVAHASFNLVAVAAVVVPPAGPRAPESGSEMTTEMTGIRDDRPRGGRRRPTPGPPPRPGPLPAVGRPAGRGSTRRTAWPAWANVVAIVGVTLVALSQLHPSLLLANTTTAGGDTGAHVVLPAFLKSHLLTHGQVTGWDPGWYDGFPLYTFYFPLPGAHHRALQRVVHLRRRLQAGHRRWAASPCRVCAWAFGRLAGLRDPGPGLPGRGHPARSCSSPASPSTAATSSPRWPASSPSPSACRSPCSSSAWSPRPPHRSAPGPGRRAVRRHAPLPSDPGAVRRGRGGGVAGPRCRPDPDVRRGRSGPRRPVGGGRGAWCGRWWPGSSASA